MSARLILGTASIVLFALYALRSASPTQAAAQVPPATPLVQPPEWFSISQTMLRPPPPVPGNAAATVKTMTLDKILELRWTYDGPGGTRKIHDERIDVLYWPTAAARVCELSPDVGGSMVVAGKLASNGHTVIERWTAALTAVPSDSNPTPFTKTVLYDGNDPGQRVVRLLAPVYGVPGKVFVQFQDVRDLHVMDAQTGALTLSLSASLAPEIAFDSYRSFWGGKLTSGKYCYVFHCRFSQDDDGAIVLYDDQPDGVVDGWVPVDKDSWGFVEALDWAERYLE